LKNSNRCSAYMGISTSHGDSKLGRTLCLNPGSEYTEGMLHGVVVELDEKGVRNYLLTVG